MKIQITLCLFMVLIWAGKSARTPKLCRTESCRTVSLIENCWEYGDCFYLKLSELPGSVRIRKRNHNDLINTVKLAYQKGRPLLFTYHDFKILSADILSQKESEKYLAAYQPVDILTLDSITGNCQYDDFRELYKVYKNRFFCFLKDSFHIQRTNYPLFYGCEARAGIISLFLEKCTKVKSYKLFLSGHIRFPHHHKLYNWVNHTINIIPFRNHKRTELYIFDPFSLDEWVTLEHFLMLLKKSGSYALKYHMTNMNVFVSFSQCKRGILDKNHDYARSIFKTLYD